jgi:CCR4-NOT transcriptional regulation complex NOT5 subunit
MTKYPRCERCKYEDTDKCETCSKKLELSEITPEDAIEYFQEDNDYLERRIGEEAKSFKEYRIRKMAIDAIREKYLSLPWQQD